jgi:hypothetical protein
MRLNWNSTVAGFVRAKIEALLQSEPTGPYDDCSVARATNALPVYHGFLGALVLTANGDVLFYDCDSEQTTRESEERTVIAAISAAGKYPELREILPVRPPEATTCAACSGAGRVSVTPTVRLFCGKCWGLGWIP